MEIHGYTQGREGRKVREGRKGEGWVINGGRGEGKSRKKLATTLPSPFH